MTCLIFLNFLFIESVEIFAAYEFSLLRNCSPCLRVTECLSSQLCMHLIKLSDTYRADIPHLSNSNFKVHCYYFYIFYHERPIAVLINHHLDYFGQQFKHNPSLEVSLERLSSQ